MNVLAIIVLALRRGLRLSVRINSKLVLSLHLWCMVFIYNVVEFGCSGCTFPELDFSLFLLILSLLFCAGNKQNLGIV